MLVLRPPPWAEELHSSSSNRSSSSSPALSGVDLPQSSLPPFPSSPVSDLALSLTNRRLYREVAFSLRTGLRDAEADFSFLRVKGLKTLLKFLAAVAKSETMIHLFQESQCDQRLRVVPVIFEHSLTSPRSLPSLPADPISCEEPPQVISPPTDDEVALALRVLEGCCLLDRGSRLIAAQCMAVKDVIELMSRGGLLEQSACLDALLALMLDTAVNQQEFERCDGLKRISDLVKNGHKDEEIRLRCMEFLLLLVGNILPSTTVEDGRNQRSSLSAEGAQQQLQELLAIELVPVLKKADQTLQSFSEVEGKHASLHLQAKQLLDSLDLTNWSIQ